MSGTKESTPDEAIHKGATEEESGRPDTPQRPQQSSMAGQLGHRDQDDMLKDSDTDFPEPDAEAEVSGG